MLAAADLTTVDVPQTLEETLTQIHVTNWINAFWEFYTAWELTIPVAPVVLNALHVPLVDDYNDFLAL